jgi:hypothetical protein
MTQKTPSWWDLSWATFQMGIEAQEVIALRMMKFATGGDLSGLEAQRMVTEKAHAVMQTQFDIARSMMDGSMEDAPGRAVERYRRKIRANRRRLTRS